MAAEAFKQHGVVSDVIAVAPEKLIAVRFDSGTEVNKSCLAE